MDIVDKIEEVDIKRLIPCTWNHNEESDEIYETLKNTIEKNGLRRAIIVRQLHDGHLEILNGFHRWKACKELGWTKVIVNNLGPVEEYKARAFTILLNEIRGNPNVTKLATLISEFRNSEKWDEIFKLLPYNEDQVETFARIAEDAQTILANNPTPDIPEGAGVDEVFSITVLKEQGDTIDRALATFKNEVGTGERVYQIALAFAVSHE